MLFLYKCPFGKFSLEKSWSDFSLKVPTFLTIREWLVLGNFLYCCVRRAWIQPSATSPYPSYPWWRMPYRSVVNVLKFDRIWSQILGFIWLYWLSTALFKNLGTQLDICFSTTLDTLSVQVEIWNEYLVCLLKWNKSFCKVLNFQCVSLEFFLILYMHSVHCEIHWRVLWQSW